MAGVRFPVTENNLFALRGSCSGVSVVGRSDMEVFFFSLDSAEEPRDEWSGRSTCKWGRAWLAWGGVPSPGNRIAGSIVLALP